MAGNKWMRSLQKLEGAVTRNYDPFAHVLRTKSPSVNFIFGNTHGLPEGYTIALSGPPKGGKSLLVNAFIGQLHQDNPDAIAIKYNTEMRETGQLTDRQCAVWGIDPDRYTAYDCNQPQEIFDKIETDINALCQEGAPIKLIAIDSVTGIVGRRTMGSDTILDQQRGDAALTITEGLQRILSCIRRNHIALILTTHVRAEQDPNKAKYFPTKMAAPWALKHFAEYFVTVEPNNSADGKKDLGGNEFLDTSVTDLKDSTKGERIGHKIRVSMADSSVGPKGRVGEFTLDYHNGIINIEEEIFKLATRRGIVAKTGNSYIVKDFPEIGSDQKYVGKENFARAIKENEFLSAELLNRVRNVDEELMKHGRTAVPLKSENMTDEQDEQDEESV